MADIASSQYYNPSTFTGAADVAEKNDQQNFHAITVKDLISIVICINCSTKKILFHFDLGGGLAYAALLRIQLGHCIRIGAAMGILILVSIQSYFSRSNDLFIFIRFKFITSRFQFCNSCGVHSGLLFRSVSPSSVLRGVFSSLALRLWVRLLRYVFFKKHNSTNILKFKKKQFNKCFKK